MNTHRCGPNHPCISAITTVSRAKQRLPESLSEEFCPAVMIHQLQQGLRDHEIPQHKDTCLSTPEELRWFRLQSNNCLLGSQILSSSCCRHIICRASQCLAATPTWADFSVCATLKVEQETLPSDAGDGSWFGILVPALPLPVRHWASWQSLSPGVAASHGPPGFLCQQAAARLQTSVQLLVFVGTSMQSQHLP